MYNMDLLMFLSQFSTTVCSENEQMTLLSQNDKFVATFLVRH